jgi:hypothetical protein
MQFQNILSSLRDVTACFPIPMGVEKSLLASSSEISKLKWLGQEQLEAESISLRPPQQQGDAASVGSYESTDLEDGTHITR